MLAWSSIRNKVLALPACPSRCLLLHSAHAPQVGRSFTSSSSSDASTGAAAPPPVVGCVHVSIEEAQSMTTQALRKIGWDRADAALQAEIMTAAELCGNNQGLVKMYQPHLMAPSRHYGGKPIVERETLNSAVIDARHSPGMLAAVTAVDMAVQKLVAFPHLAVSVVTTHNSRTSSGQLAFYVERAARQGFVCIMACNSPELVAAASGAKPVFGTNPLAVGIPLHDSPYPFTVRFTWRIESVCAVCLVCCVCTYCYGLSRSMMQCGYHGLERKNSSSKLCSCFLYYFRAAGILQTL